MYGALPEVNFDKNNTILGDGVIDEADDQIPYSFVIVNQSTTEALGGLRLSDTLLGSSDGDADPNGVLDVGEAWPYDASGTAETGRYANIASVTAEDENGNQVSDEHPSHYAVREPAEPGAAMMPGFWKNHPDIRDQALAPLLGADPSDLF